MAKKDKSNSSGRRQQANAPDYRYAFQQPAHNPYYPDPTVSLLTTPASAPPPPYPASSSSAARNSVQMSHVNDINYPRLHSGTSPIVIQAPGVPYDYRAERRGRKVRSFNSQAIVFYVLSIVLAIWAYSLYNDRHCIEQFVVHKLNKDTEIKISDVRQAHLAIAYAGGFLILICLLKSAIGFDGKSHSCYLFLISFISFFVCLHNAYIAYLAFYSPCVASFGEIAANSGKTFISKIVDTLPSPDKGVFGESNVIQMADRDGYGLAIFVMDVMNATLYFSIFLSSAILC